MIETKVFCDVCKKELKPEGGVAHFQGKISRLAMDADMNTQKQMYQFAEDFCPACSEIILKFISELKKDVQTK